MAVDVDALIRALPERLISEGVAAHGGWFHGQPFYLIDTDYVLDNFFGAYNKEHDGIARDALLYVEDERQAEVTRIISVEGFRAPIAASSGFQLVDGHARLAAALALGMPRVPVSFSVFYEVQSGNLSLLDDAISLTV
jgi:hypothetical protein